MKNDELVPKESNESKLYTLTDKGTEYLEAWSDHISNNPDTDSSGDGESDKEAPQDTDGREILAVDFILRNHPPHPQIGIRFGDWTKGDCIFHRVELPAKDKSGEDSKVTCYEELTTNTEGRAVLKVTCSKCNHSVDGYCETKAKPGNTRKYCLATMCEECPLKEENQYEIAPDEVYNTFTYVITGFETVTAENVNEIAKELKTTPEDVRRCWKKFQR
jgi:hypothetical protein